MKVFVVTHNKKTGGRVRGVFFTKKAAEEYIRPGIVAETIPCGDCGHPKPNPEYDPLEAWKSCLAIGEWTVEGDQNENTNADSR